MCSHPILRAVIVVCSFDEHRANVSVEIEQFQFDFSIRVRSAENRFVVALFLCTSSPTAHANTFARTFTRHTPETILDSSMPLGIRESVWEHEKNTHNHGDRNCSRTSQSQSPIGAHVFTIWTNARVVVLHLLLRAELFTFPMLSRRRFYTSTRRIPKSVYDVRDATIAKQLSSDSLRFTAHHDPFGCMNSQNSDDTLSCYSALLLAGFVMRRRRRQRRVAVASAAAVAAASAASASVYGFVRFR